MKYYLIVLKRYAQFSGRADRSEYWYFVLFNIIFALAAMLLDNLLRLNFPNLPYGIIYAVYVLAVLVPGLAAAVRRLHDINKSGWYLLVALIPIAGAIWLLVLMASKGTHEENTYGPSPNGEPTFEFENQHS
ncbi:MAG: DUF805 domain-containing protein [Chitinophagaceae bacterium]|nr:DUF805 domain-containing protein [Chitinophagaceae bacterium]